jgi:hypothetical protein
LVVFRLVGQNAVRTILYTHWGVTVTAAAVGQMIKRTKTKQTVEVPRIGTLVTGKGFTFIIFEV